MIRYIILTIFFVGLKSLTFAQLTVRDSVAIRAKYKQYLHREVYNFLLHDDIRRYKEVIMGDEPPGVLSYLFIVVNDSVNVALYFKHLEFQEQQNFQRDWDLKLLYKEKIWRIVFYSKDERNSFVIK
jgi:hypothetical protein